MSQLTFVRCFFYLKKDKLEVDSESKQPPQNIIRVNEQEPQSNELWGAAVRPKFDDTDTRNS